ncbi:DUF6054 family protein [Gordonia humi]|uniref:DUF6054 family protein n=1 Tax=Gordonia humi TaxID=686429 RepID=UPI003620BC1B
MAKYERIFRGDFDAVVGRVHDGVLSASMSASYEDGSNIEPRGVDVRCAVRVFERYSAFGGNRVAMNVTIVGSRRPRLRLRDHRGRQSGRGVEGQHPG